MTKRSTAGGKDTRASIIDAAERVFAEKGFYGASLREICTVAGIRPGLLHYYFESKEPLFETTVTRRADEMRAIFNRCIDDVVAARAGHPSPTDLCRAYIRFFFDLSRSRGDGWRSYITLLTQTAAAYDVDIVRNMLRGFDFIAERMTIEFARASPWAPDEAIRASLFYLECAVTTALVSSGLHSVRTRTVDADAVWDRLADDMARFFARGMAVDTARGAELASRDASSAPVSDG